jgi:hypothetical protein
MLPSPSTKLLRTIKCWNLVWSTESGVEGKRWGSNDRNWIVTNIYAREKLQSHTEYCSCLDGGK